MDDVFSARLARIEEALSDALATGDLWRRDSFGALPASVTDVHIRELVEPCKNLVESGGKRWRPLLLVLCADLARGAHGENALLSADETYTLSPLVEFVHTASLIHDDIEDGADMRRGKPACHIAYGLDVALNAASWLYFEAAVCIDTLPLGDAAKTRFYALYTKELRRLHLGQAMDILWHRNPTLFPRPDEYRAMVQNKTGTLASLAAKAGIMAGGGSDDEMGKAGTLAAELGEAFQILDDVQNLTTGNPGKKRGDDIVEGKKSLPVLLHVEAHPEDKERIAALFAEAHADGITSPAVETCIALLEKSGAIVRAFEKGKKLAQEKSAALGSLYGAAKADDVAETDGAGALIIELFSAMMKKQADAFGQR